MNDTQHRHPTFGNYTSVGNILPNVPSFAVTTNGTTAMVIPESFARGMAVTTNGATFTVIPEGIPESFARGMAELELDREMDARSELELLLEKLNACAEARDWVREGGYLTLSEAWAACPRGDWMMWYAGKLSGAPEGEGRKKLVRAACACARLALPFAQSPAVLVCIETAEAWANGKATIGEVRSASDAADAASAYDAASTAAASAAAGATYAAPDTVYASASASASASDARERTLAQCADIVRKHYPEPPSPMIPNPFQPEASK